MYIEITKDMVNSAQKEAQRRNPYIQHHFEVEHLSGDERDIIGFLGEFACSELLNKDWKSNIRQDYFTIDNGDIIIDGKVIDIKTETIPIYNLNKILSNTCGDDELYGRRLINQGQVCLLDKYDIIVFGAFARGDYTKWYPIGYLESDFIKENYNVTSSRPDGGRYPFAGLPVRTSELKCITELIKS